MPSYIVQEEDGTSKITLEEDGGFILTEESTAASTTTNNALAGNGEAFLRMKGLL